MSEVQQGIEERVKRIITEQFIVDGLEPPSIASENRFDHDLGFDSLDCVEVTMCVEDEFDIYIDDTEMRGIETVQKLIDTVRAKI
ncbi:acyl carrier protein [Paraburkholderia caffeinilytica]|uniref:acyl carrier protein n=1 Tax=Paraburkholderia caffeinilytica TaxID=1761016 RepID=UPI0038BB2D0F